MSDLSPRQRAILKALAHSLKAVQHVGKEGVTDTLVRSVVDALNNRELIKVRVLETAPAGAQQIGEELAARIDGASVVQVIGRMIVLYRRHPEKPLITLPG
jgi:RNA-binding protein